MSLLISDCQKCANLGFRLPVSVGREFPHTIPFSIVFENAYACDCPAGRWWAEQQLEYIAPPASNVAPIRELKPAMQVLMFPKAG